VQHFNSLFRSAEAAGEYHSAIVEVASKADVARAAARVKELGFEVSDRGAERAALLLAVLVLVFALVSTAILVVAAIHIMHVFSMLVVQRQREIGLMRAVGASRGDIRRIILGEAALVGAGAGVVGVLLARAAMYGADLLADRLIPPFPYKPETFFHLSPGLAAAAVALAVVSCVVGAVVPAHQAANRDAAEVLSGR
jgi:ABC-type antimicrobial peptide transport system permease subunit